MKLIAPFSLVAILSAGCASTRPVRPTLSVQSDHSHQHASADHPAPLGLEWRQGWSEPWPHCHSSPLGTPFVHSFAVEPAFLDRDLFVNYRSVRAPDEDESEVEVELEWALTRRLGVVLELPFAQLDPDGASSESGVGDLVIAPRALLVDTERVLVAANLEFSLPTGDDDAGLGAGELGLAPSLAAWFDLGGWKQLSVQAGTEHGVESGDAELFYGASFAYSMLTPAHFKVAEHRGHSHAGAAPLAGLMSGICEFTGRTILDGDDRDRSTAELLLGLSCNLNGTYELRAGYQFPVGGDEDLDRALVLSVIRHF